MTLSEMLWSMTDVDSITDKVRVSKEDVRAIAAALKAGQIMYEALLDLADEHGLVYEEAITAWDEAIKEDL